MQAMARLGFAASVLPGLAHDLLWVSRPSPSAPPLQSSEVTASPQTVAGLSSAPSSPRGRPSCPGSGRKTGLRSGPNRPVCAGCVQSRCAIDLTLLRWSAMGSSNALIWARSTDAQVRRCGAVCCICQQQGLSRRGIACTLQLHLSGSACVSNGHHAQSCHLPDLSQPHASRCTSPPQRHVRRSSRLVAPDDAHELRSLVCCP